ncbi:dTMP kinase [Desulfitibacter alkalitolerans]|uniref:dTMP kinase n=1 Tax=Desulfitibacter alkalitolerans TaxID=264641 RepID=UPI0004848409|nr:dTMP kinase [Desulfitibacter alkalitolerans]
MRGIFITMEGPDGSGKSTQAKRLFEYLRGKGYNVVLTREPGGTSVGEQIRNILLNPDNSELGFKTEVLLYAASRAQHLEEVIIPALKEGKTVISDRFVDSSIAYQGYGRSLNLPLVVEINRLVVENYMPDLTILLDLPVEVGLERIRKKQKSMDRLEQEAISFHEQVYHGFKKLAFNEKRIKTVSADGSEDMIFAHIVKMVEEKLKEVNLIV